MPKRDFAGFPIFTQKEVLDHLYEHPDFDVTKVEGSVVGSSELVQAFLGQKTNYPTVGSIGLKEAVIDVDTLLQDEWKMPENYKTMDIISYIWELRKTDSSEETQRVDEELNIFISRKLLDLLRYLCYLVDTMRANNIVWGVGRGSSVASYVLYLIGIHKIDSLKFKIDPKEFFK